MPSIAFLFFDKKNCFFRRSLPREGTSNVIAIQALTGPRLGERVLVEPSASGRSGDGGGSASLPASFLGPLGNGGGSHVDGGRKSDSLTHQWFGSQKNHPHGTYGIFTYIFMVDFYGIGLKM